MAAVNLAAIPVLDLSGPVDVDAVESTVTLFYGAGTQEQVRSVDKPPAVCRANLITLLSVRDTQEVAAIIQASR